MPTLAYSGPRLTQAQREQRFFDNLGKSLERKRWCFGYGPAEEERTCILPAADTFSWKDASCGTTWIALRGTKGYIVVAMDPKHTREYYPGIHPPVSFALMSVLHQMGDPSSTFNQVIADRAQGKPFAVVSTAPETFVDPQERTQASSRAIDFLKEKLNEGSDFTLEKIGKIGVCGLEKMFGPNFKPNQIVRAFCDGVGGGSRTLGASDVDEYLKPAGGRFSFC